MATSYKTTERIDWERARLALGWALNSTIIMAEYKIDIRTAWRDIKYLKQFYGEKMIYIPKDRAFYLATEKIMTKEDMRSKYGRSLKGRALYNRAIREECPGGAETLEAMELVSAMRGRCRDDEECEKLTIIEDKLQTIRERMLIDVRNRWGLIERTQSAPEPSREAKDSGAKTPQTRQGEDYEKKNIETISARKWALRSR